MSEAQLGKSLTDDEAAGIVAFLKTLSAPVPESFAPPPPTL